MLKVNEKCNCLKVNCYLLGIFGYKVGDLQLSETIFIVQSEKSPSSDGSESRLGIDSTLTRHFLADSYSILLEESRLGLDFSRLGLARTQKGLTSDGS